MKRTCLGLLTLCFSLNAWSVGSLANVEVLNRDSGETLPVYRHHGEYWVAGTPGARYAVVVRNLRGERVLAVTSVDGVNVISGETAAWNQSGYVFTAGESYAINGWRKSNQEVADFNFTALPDSYAARTGRPANVGIIGVALFLEKQAPVVHYPPEAYRSQDSAATRSAPAPLNESDAISGATLAGRASPPPLVEGIGGNARRPSTESLGTGHGARESSYVSNTQFERLSETPNEVIRIRYDRLENLVAMGIVRGRPTPAVPNAFPESAVSRYVPDPPGGI
jgi:hypothetical protein